MGSVCMAWQKRFHMWFHLFIRCSLSLSLSRSVNRRAHLTMATIRNQIYAKECTTPIFWFRLRSIEMENWPDNRTNSHDSTCSSAFSLLLFFILFALSLIQLRNKRINKRTAHFLQFTNCTSRFYLIIAGLQTTHIKNQVKSQGNSNKKT